MIDVLQAVRQPFHLGQVNRLCSCQPSKQHTTWCWYFRICWDISKIFFFSCFPIYTTKDHCYMQLFINFVPFHHYCYMGLLYPISFCFLSPINNNIATIKMGHYDQTCSFSQVPSIMAHLSSFSSVPKITVTWDINVPYPN